MDGRHPARGDLVVERVTPDHARLDLRHGMGLHGCILTEPPASCPLVGLGGVGGV